MLLLRKSIKEFCFKNAASKGSIRISQRSQRVSFTKISTRFRCTQTRARFFNI